MIRLNEATISWRDEDTAFAPAFDDVYFARGGGVDETNYVFLAQNHLPDRWQNNPHDFTIAELGFGTGLNFLATWMLWEKTSTSSSWLHYVSCEKFPLRPDDLRSALQKQNLPSEKIEKLLANYPPPLQGFHRIVFDEARITLTLLWGDAAENLSELSAHIDAWFLDGFAPAQNPDLWNEKIWQEIKRLSQNGTSFATFTAARAVREGLSAIGFAVEKVKGFGKKRDMLRGIFEGSGTNHTPTKPSHILVVGSGLAGAHTAFALARRGIKVTVIDEKDEIAGGASGNQAGAFYPKLTADLTHQALLNLAGFFYTKQILEKMRPRHDCCGVILLDWAEEIQKRHEKIFEFWQLPENILTRPAASDLGKLAGIALCQSGLYFPTAGWIDPKDFCRKLLDQPNITLQLGEKFMPAMAESFDGVVYAGGFGALHDFPNLRLEITRGQITILNTPTHKLEKIICHKGYVVPQNSGIILGSTYQRHDEDQNLRDQDHEENINQAKKYLPALFDTHPMIKTEDIKGRAGLRLAAFDRFPAVGKAPDLLQCNNFYFNSAHGSHGLTTTALSGEICTDFLLGSPIAVPESLQKRLCPGRLFAAKQ